LKTHAKSKRGVHLANHQLTHMNNKPQRTLLSSSRG
jgi:hypothetical protein